MIVTNAVTGTYVNRLSKKDIRASQRKLDSLRLMNIQLEKKLLAEKIIRREIFLKDSLDLLKLDKVNKDLQRVVNKQNNLILKYKSIPSTTVSLHKLDSAYEAEN